MMIHKLSDNTSEKTGVLHAFHYFCSFSFYLDDFLAINYVNGNHLCLGIGEKTSSFGRRRRGG